MATALVPGSFDPVTYGHLDVIEGVLQPPGRDQLLGRAERGGLAQGRLAGRQPPSRREPQVRSRPAIALVRGLLLDQPVDLLVRRRQQFLGHHPRNHEEPIASELEQVMVSDHAHHLIL